MVRSGFPFVMNILTEGPGRQAPLWRVENRLPLDPAMMMFRPLLFLLILALCSMSTPLLHGQALPTAEDKKTDKAQMLQIWKALQAYKEAKGNFPDYLSDLVPDFLPDKEVLLSPDEKAKPRNGENPYDDPKLPCSYMYLLSAAKSPPGNLPIREMAKALIDEFGPAMPILQRFSPAGLNLSVSYAGDYFESQPMWQTAPEFKELMKKHGIGPGFKKGTFTRLKVVSEGGTPVAEAEVRLTGRQGPLGLPDRTLKTDADGTVKVPLAITLDGPESHQVTVHVSKPGQASMTERWSNQDYQEERQITLAPAASVGGVVKLKNGAPLSEAEILVAVPAKDPKDTKSEQFIALVKSNKEGRWTCDGVPKNFEALKLTVKHPSIRPTDFSTAKEATTVTRDTLLASNAELLVTPAPVIRGEVIGSDGAPLRRAEIFLHPLVLKSIASNENGEEDEAETENSAIRLPELPLKTDHTGSFSISWPDAGDVLVTVFAEGHAPAQQVVTTSEETPLIRFALESGRMASGTLLDYEGKPVSGADVYLQILGQRGLPRQRKVAKTDAEGRFSWEHAPNQRFTLLFMSEGYTGALKDVAGDGPVQTAVKIGKMVKEMTKPE